MGRSRLAILATALATLLLGAACRNEPTPPRVDPVTVAAR
jgi:hypothetical protein